MEHDVVDTVIRHRREDRLSNSFLDVLKFAVFEGHLGASLSRCDLRAFQLRLGFLTILFLGRPKKNPLFASGRESVKVVANATAPVRLGGKTG